MSKAFLSAFVGAILLIAGAVAFYSYSQRGLHLEPTGRMVHVRTVAVDPSTSVVVLDFEISNSSDREMIVRSATVTLHQKDSSILEGGPIAASDLPALFQFHQEELGALGHPPLRDRDRIAPHQTLIATVGSRFDIPESALRDRASLQLVVEDVTGPKLDLSSK